MVDFFGQGHNNLRNLNRIGDRGGEGIVNMKSEIFDLSGAVALADFLKSDILDLPEDSVLVGLRYFKNFNVAGSSWLVQAETRRGNNLGVVAPVTLDLGTIAPAVGMDDIEPPNGIAPGWFGVSGAANQVLMGGLKFRLSPQGAAHTAGAGRLLILQVFYMNL